MSKFLITNVVQLNNWAQKYNVTLAHVAAQSKIPIRCLKNPHSFLTSLEITKLKTFCWEYTAMIKRKQIEMFAADEAPGPIEAPDLDEPSESDMLDEVVPDGPPETSGQASSVSPLPRAHDETPVAYGDEDDDFDRESQAKTIRDMVATGSRNNLIVGRLFLRAKKKIGPGGFTAFVENDTACSLRTVQKAMKVARMLGDRKNADSSFLPWEALCDLAASRNKLQVEQVGRFLELLLGEDPPSYGDFREMLKEAKAQGAGQPKPWDAGREVEIREFNAFLTQRLGSDYRDLLERSAKLGPRLVALHLKTECERNGAGE